MKKEKNLVSMGIIIYIVSSGINRFIYKIPDYIYVPIALLAIVLILIGFIKNKKRK